MKNVILYFPYELLTNPKSGSGVRPQKIISAFTNYCEQHNLELILVSGESHERFKQLDQLSLSNKLDHTIACYIENHTMPYWFTDKDHIPKSFTKDYTFWKLLKRKGVPIGIFYRDIHWKFDDLYVLKGKKRFLTPVMKMMYRLELRHFSKIAHTLFLPSTEMNEYVQWQGNIETLPPAMTSFVTNKKVQPSNKGAIYVGGISDRYGADLLLKAFSIINQEQLLLPLHLVCRKEEYDESPFFSPYKNANWLNVYHLSGKELDAVYEKASIALIPLKTTSYQNFAIPVKMFEYMSYRLPIVSTNCTALAKIIEKEQVGLITKCNAEAFANGVLEMLNEDTYEHYQNNINDDLLQKHSWFSRIERLMNTLRK